MEYAAKSMARPEHGMAMAWRGGAWRGVGVGMGLACLAPTAASSSSSYCTGACPAGIASPTVQYRISLASVRPSLTQPRASPAWPGLGHGTSQAPNRLAVPAGLDPPRSPPGTGNLVSTVDETRTSSSMRTSLAAAFWGKVGSRPRNAQRL